MQYPSLSTLPPTPMGVCWGEASWPPQQQSFVLHSSDGSSAVACCGGIAPDGVPIMVIYPQVPQFLPVLQGQLPDSSCSATPPARSTKRSCSTPMGLWSTKRSRTSSMECLPEEGKDANSASTHPVSSSPKNDPAEVEMQDVDVEDESEAHIKHLADWLLTEIRSGGERLSSAATSAFTLATSDKSSCKAVQQAFERAKPSEATALSSGFRNRVREVIANPNGNHVIQKMIQSMPSSPTCFITEELRGSVDEVAKCRFGCRVICRLLEHRPLDSASMVGLVDEILLDVDRLSCHNFGNYVIQHLLEFGLPHQREKVAHSIAKEACNNARNRNAVRVIEKILTYCSPMDCNSLVAPLLKNPQTLPSLAEHAFGCFVVKALIQAPEYKQAALNVLQPYISLLSTKKYGKKALGDLLAPPTMLKLAEFIS